MPIVSRKSPRPYQTARIIREKLVEEGMDRWRTSATPMRGLPDLVEQHRAGQLRLVPDVADGDLDTVPRLGANRLDPITRMINDGCSEDEIASVLTFARGRLVEHGLTADARTPWDEFIPDGAA
jgi:hypothetical protein